MLTQQRLGRFEAELDLEIEWGGAHYQGRSRNISLGGMFILSDIDVAFDDLISIEFQILKPKHKLRLEAKVRWNSQEGFGVAFEALKPVDVGALQRYFSSGGS